MRGLIGARRRQPIKSMRMAAKRRSQTDFVEVYPPTNWSRSTLFAVVKVVHVSNSFSKGLGRLPVMPHFLPLTARNGGIGSEF